VTHEANIPGRLDRNELTMLVESIPDLTPDEQNIITSEESIGLEAVLCQFMWFIHLISNTAQ
jgi:hypothetical protein